MRVTKEQYLQLSDEYDKHARELVAKKGEEYSLDGDFLAMENLGAGILDIEAAAFSLTLAIKHIAAMVVILKKNDVSDINLKKWDERVRDGCNLIKIASAFIHAEHNDFTVHQ